MRTITVSLLLTAAGCIGGQTTVPTSGPPASCTPIDSGTVDADHLGIHTLEVRWARTDPGGTLSEGATRVTVDIALYESASSCSERQLVTFEVSSADGLISASGLAVVISTSPSLALELLDEPLRVGGELVFGPELELTLDYLDGSTIEARGRLED